MASTSRFSKYGYLVAVCLITMALTGCKGTPAFQPTPTPMPAFSAEKGMQTVKCPFYVRPEAKVSCGTLEVPEDYAELDGEKIELFAVIIHSLNPLPARDPIVLLPLSNSVSALDFLPQIGRIFEDYLEERDILYYDPRGLGKSGATLDCPEYTPVYYQFWLQALSPGEEFALVEPAVRTCRDRLLNDQVDPNTYTPAVMAADLNILRLALGYSQFNLLAGGFGADLVFNLIRDYPLAVRSAILVDFQVPFSYINLETFSISAQESFDLLFNHCSLDQECRLAYPDLENQFYAIVDQMNLSPATIDALIPGQTKIAKVQLNGDDFILLMVDMLSNTRSLSGIPKLVDELSHGKMYRLSEFVQSYRIALPDDYHVGVELSVICSELHANFLQVTPASQEVQPVIQQALQSKWDYYRQLCPLWTGRSLNPPAGSPLTSDVPVLVMQGEFNPYYAPDLVSELLRGLKNSAQVVIPNLSNDVFGGESCAGVLVDEWLKNPGKRLDTSCIDQTETIDFLMPQK